MEGFIRRSLEMEWSWGCLSRGGGVIDLNSMVLISFVEIL